MRKPGGVVLAVLEDMRKKGGKPSNGKPAGISEGLKSASADLLSAIGSGDADKVSSAFMNMHHIANGET